MDSETLVTLFKLCKQNEDDKDKINSKFEEYESQIAEHAIE